MDRFKKVFPIILIIMFELLILALLNLSVFVAKTDAYPTGNLTNFIFPMNAILLILALFTVIMFIRISSNIQEDAENQVRLESQKHLEELLQTMRRQRHEFNHHLQTVYGFLVVEAYEEARKYLNEILEEIVVTNAIISVDNLGVSAFLHVKSGQMESYNVQFEVINTASLKTIPVKTSELNEVIGNLLDNALDAVRERSVKKPQIKLIISQKAEEYIFSVVNNGPPISQSLIDKIFNPGFSTKNEHLGMGLHIIKQIVEKYGGTINITSDEKATIFKVTIKDDLKERRVYGDEQIIHSSS